MLFEFSHFFHPHSNLTKVFLSLFVYRLSTMAKLINGREVSKQIKDKLREEVKHLKVVPLLAIVQVGDRDDSNVYIKMKIKFAQEVGVKTRHFKLSTNTTEKKV